MIELKLVLLIRSGWVIIVVVNSVVDHKLACSFDLLGLVNDVAVIVDLTVVVHIRYDVLDPIHRYS